VDISTKIQIAVSRDYLYEIEFEDVRMPRILEMMMRRYTGIFSYPVPIDEEYIASQIGLSVPMFRQLLYKMSLEHVIRYIPSDHATVLYLHHERLRPKNLNLDPEKYDLLKGASDDRMQKMMDYVQEDDTCRSAYLLEYFGQKESADCGTCDVCRNGKKTAVQPLEKRIREFVNEKSGRYTLSEISARFCSAENPDSDNFATILRRLIDQEEVPAPVD
jgi:ATP-dependent DNA helicase RecQ